MSKKEEAEFHEFLQRSFADKRIQDAAQVVWQKVCDMEQRDNGPANIKELALTIRLPAEHIALALQLLVERGDITRKYATLSKQGKIIRQYDTMDDVKTDDPAEYDVVPVFYSNRTPEAKIAL